MPLGTGASHAVEKIVPIQGSLRNVKTADAITAYPHCTTKQCAVPIHVQHDQRMREIRGVKQESVELTDAELEIVRRLCETSRFTLSDPREDHPHPIKTIQLKILFNPHKRIYRYSEGPSPRQ